MHKPKEFNRSLIVVGAIIIQLCLGAIYAWSVFRKPLESKLNITPTQATLPFSIVLIFFAISTIFGGRWQDKVGPRIVAIAGGLLLGLGLIFASFANGIVPLVLSYGVISGIGIGLAYVCPISAGVKWFPDKRGLITGLSVAGFGAGALVVGPLARLLIDSESIGVFKTFRILGIAFFILTFLGALILRNPPVGYKPPNWQLPTKTVIAKKDFSVTDMLSTKQFYFLWFMFFIGCATGLMIIGQTSPIGPELAHYSKQTAALGVSLLAIFNTLGRIFWGRISDLIGRQKTLISMYLLSGLAMFSYNLISSLPLWFWFATSLVGFCFGGYLALFPAITADFFGTNYV
ncbi:MAG: OFA family MFS transporter, partial [candidate division WOR-3 bacterium]|nr:OFA family MFS transporter [candidate division WOR-3 bacterium]